METLSNLRYLERQGPTEGGHAQVNPMILSQGAKEYVHGDFGPPVVCLAASQTSCFLSKWVTGLRDTLLKKSCLINILM